MAEYIDRAWLAGKLTSSGLQAVIREMDGSEAYSFMLAMLNSIPAADVVEVVRCKDCKHWSSDCGVEDRVCLKIYSEGQASVFAWQERKADDFCSYGERRDDDG